MSSLSTARLPSLDKSSDSSSAGSGASADESLASAVRLACTLDSVLFGSEQELSVRALSTSRKRAYERRSCTLMATDSELACGDGRGTRLAADVDCIESRLCACADDCAASFHPMPAMKCGCEPSERERGRSGADCFGAGSCDTMTRMPSGPDTLPCHVVRITASLAFESVGDVSCGALLGSSTACADSETRVCVALGTGRWDAESDAALPACRVATVIVVLLLDGMLVRFDTIEVLCLCVLPDRPRPLPCLTLLGMLLDSRLTMLGLVLLSKN